MQSVSVHPSLSPSFSLGLSDNLIARVSVHYRNLFNFICNHVSREIRRFVLARAFVTIRFMKHKQH
jgi:hypothetical protein